MKTYKAGRFSRSAKKTMHKKKHAVARKKMYPIARKKKRSIARKRK